MLGPIGECAPWPARPREPTHSDLSSAVSCLNSTSHRLDIKRPSLPLTVRWEEYVPKYLKSITSGTTFVQIGANCGTNTLKCGLAGDPIWEYATRCGWKGVALEPFSQTFAKLCKNYEPFPRVRPLNAAVSNRSGSARLMTGLAGGGEANRLSTNPMGRMWKARLAGGPSEAVRLLSMHDLWGELRWLRHRREVDVLVVDAEGEEERILGTGPLPEPVPRLVFFEHKHLKDRQVATIERNLAKQGFERIAEIPHVARTGALHRGDMLYGRPRR